MAQEGKIEQRVTPQQELEWLRRKVYEKPERAVEAIQEHLRQSPEQVYAVDHLPSPEEIVQMEQRLSDANYREKEEALKYLFEMAEEKGILNAAQIAKKLDPALQDEFHDRLVSYLRQSGE